MFVAGSVNKLVSSATNLTEKLSKNSNRNKPFKINLMKNKLNFLIFPYFGVLITASFAINQERYFKATSRIALLGVASVVATFYCENVAICEPVFKLLSKIYLRHHCNAYEPLCFLRIDEKYWTNACRAWKDKLFISPIGFVWSHRHYQRV